MTVQISIRDDLDKITRGLNDIQRKQIPFAASGALNDTAFQARTKATDELPRHIDRPTPATVKGIMVRKSKKTDLEAAVFFKDFVWKYMKYQVLGGTRSDSRKFAVPSRQSKLNKYGNIPGRRTGLTKGLSYFGRVNDSLTGVFKPRGKKRDLKAILVNRAVYKPRYPFSAIVERSVKDTFKKNFDKSMERALRTAR